MRNFCRAICPPAWTLLLLTGCGPPIQYASQELLVRHNASPDTLDVLILYDGIQSAPNERDLSLATKFVERVVGGRREFMLIDWPLHLDLDSAAADVSEHSDPSKMQAAWEAWRRDGLACLEQVSVASSGFYADDRNRLSMYQRFHILDATRLVDLFNRSLQLSIEERVQDGTLAKETPLLDDETRAAWARLGKEQIKWLGLKDGGLELDVPMTPASLARISAELTRVRADRGALARIYAFITSSPTEMHSSDGHLRLRLGPTKGAIRLHGDGFHDYDPSLSDHLRSSTDAPKQLPARAEVLRAFDEN